jgi:NAD(P)-dependent dehydrogenase (short-subunit alcohol dehydrogenase family)
MNAREETNSPLEGKNVVITGATGALGSVLTRLTARAGARGVIVAHREGEGRSLLEELAGAADRFSAVEADVTDPDSVEKMVREAEERLGSIDVMFLAAGGYSSGKAHETGPEDWDRMMNLNARSVFLCVRAALPSMLERKAGSIVAVGAMAALRGKKGGAHYSASKAAVVNFIEGVAEEGKEAGVRANVVLPSIIDTKTNRESMPKADFDEWVSPEEVSRLMIHLGSDAASGVTGAAVAVPGRS